MTQTEVELMANALNYDDAKAMFEDLYTKEELSINQISRRLGIGPATVNRWLRTLDIPRRSKGGANRYPILHYRLHMMDQREIFSKSNVQLAEEVKMNNAYVYKYKQRVKGAKFDAIHTNSASVPDGEVFEGQNDPDGSGSSG